MNNLEVSLKGISISLTDNKPKELLYFCMNELDLKLEKRIYKYNDKKGTIEVKENFMMDIANI
jgi:hypothetical protein